MRKELNYQLGDNSVWLQYSNKDNKKKTPKLKKVQKELPIPDFKQLGQRGSMCSGFQLSGRNLVPAKSYLRVHSLISRISVRARPELEVSRPASVVRPNRVLAGFVTSLRMGLGHLSSTCTSLCCETDVIHSGISRGSQRTASLTGTPMQAAQLSSGQCPRPPDPPYYHVPCGDHVFH